jgi:large subunit ribosomal protein L21
MLNNAVSPPKINIEQGIARSTFRLPSYTFCDTLRGFFLPRRDLMTYAIIKTGGRQYRVAEGDTIDVDLLDVEPGKTATFQVLMHIDGSKISDGGKVTAEVVEQRKDKKVVAFKYKRRKGYHRTVGHRRKLTRVKIKSITGGSKSKKS